MGRWRARDEDGFQVFEFVLVLPFVLILVFLLVEMTAALQTWMTLEHASREGARAAAVRQSAGDVVSRTVNRSDGLLSPGQVTVTGAGGPSGSDVTVGTVYEYVPNTPLVTFAARFLGRSVPTIQMHATTHMRLE
jgi:Flp pilus assembly protein TadG